LPWWPGRNYNKYIIAAQLKCHFVIGPVAQDVGGWVRGPPGKQVAGEHDSAFR
jgi:hypothetical protein